MRFFEIYYIPKGTGAYEIIGDILSDINLVNEINESVEEKGLFVAKVTVDEKTVAKAHPKEAKAMGKAPPSKMYRAKVAAHRKKRFGEGEKVSADFDIHVVSGENHDCIVLNGRKEYEGLGKLLLSHVRRKVLPKLDPLEHVIVVKSY